VSTLKGQQFVEGDDDMTSIGKRAAGIGAVVALIATAGPVTLAGASTGPAAAPAPAVSPYGALGPAYQAGYDAAIGGWNAGADAAVGGWNAGAAALGLPFQFTVGTSGPFGVHTAGVAALQPSK
jgi:hypothetical protein